MNQRELHLGMLIADLKNYAKAIEEETGITPEEAWKAIDTCVNAMIGELRPVPQGEVSINIIMKGEEHG